MPNKPGRLSRWSLPLAIAGAVVVVGAPLGYRVGAVPLVAALLGPVAGVLLSIVVLLVAVTTLLRGRVPPGRRRPVIGAAAIAAVTGLGPLFIALSAASFTILIASRVVCCAATVASLIARW